MKKTLIKNITLSIACLLGLGGAVMLGTNASKEGNLLEVHADDHTHNDTTFSEWTSTNSLPSSGNYYLTNDVTISSTWQPSSNTKLCLNGHGIIMTGTGNAIQVSAAGNLYIYDCNKSITHRYKIDETGLATVNDAFESDYETFSGGYITGANGGSTGGAIYLPGGSSKGNTTRLYMYGGTIIGNKTTGNGAAINYTYKKNMNSEMDIRDTVIMGNVADGNSGGIFHHANNRSLTLVNTKIYKNVAASRPAGLFEQAQLKVQGDSYIYENRLKNGSPSDISVNHSGQTDTFTITGELSQNAKFGLDDIRRSAIYNYFSYNDGVPNEVFVSNTNKLVRRDGNNVVYNNVTPTGYTGNYDGQPHSISLALDDDSIDHTIKYGLTEGTYDLDTNPEFTLPGDYTVYYQVTMGLNTHKSSSKVTINALPVDYTAPTAKTDLHYNGEVQALVNAGTVINGTMYYKVDDGDWSTDVASALSAGTYTVSYKVVGDPGYESVDPDSFQVTISPNDKSTLVDKILEKKDYYDSIKDQYPGVAGLLDEVIKQAETVRDDDNKTVQEIADAVAALDNAFIDANDRIAKVNEAIEKINAIGEVTLEKEELITAARTAYDSLVDKAKLDVTNYQVLEDSEIALQHLKDQAEADKVKTLINKIGEVEYTSESKGKIDAARTAYNALTAEQKALVTNYSTLVEARNRYNELEAAKGEADAVDALINAIGEVKYPDSKNAIDAARSAYEALNSDGKSFVTKLSTLEAAESSYSDLRSAAIIDAIEKINDIGTVTYPGSKDKIDAAKDAYDLLLEADQPEVTNKGVLDASIARYEELEAAKAKADVVVDKIDAIGEVKYPDSGEAILDARAAYDALTSDDERNFVSNYPDLLAAEAKYKELKNKGADDAKDLINAIGDVEDTKACKDKIDAARSAYDALTEEQKALIDPDAKNTLEAKEAEYKALHDQNEANAVKNLINSIGEVSYPDSKDAIDAARSAYDALTSDQKALISEEIYSVLTAAEAEYARLEANHEAAEEVEELVDEIDLEDIDLTPESKEYIKAAREAYNALTEEQKELVGAEFLEKLESAEKILETMEKIDAIGEVKLDEESKERIDDARTSYDDLTEEEKASVTNYPTLTDAEQTYETLVKKHNTAVALAIVFGILGGLILLICGAWALMLFVFNKWIKVDDKAVRAFKLFGLKKKDGTYLVLAFPVKFVGKVDEEIFSSKEDALK